LEILRLKAIPIEAKASVKEVVDDEASFSSTTEIHRVTFPPP
jgi:hypothetical protein